jgi:hypothetical protein
VLDVVLADVISVDRRSIGRVIALDGGRRLDERGPLIVGHLVAGEREPQDLELAAIDRLVYLFRKRLPHLRERLGITLHAPELQLERSSAPIAFRRCGDLRFPVGLVELRLQFLEPGFQR